MAKFNGFGGGGFNMQSLMKQAQQMQESMQRAEAELQEAEVVGSASGGLVEVVMSGKKDVKAVKIKPEVVDPDDVEMLEDLIKAALNDANAKADELQRQKLPQGVNGLM